MACHRFWSFIKNLTFFKINLLFNFITNQNQFKMNNKIKVQNSPLYSSSELEERIKIYSLEYKSVVAYSCLSWFNKSILLVNSQIWLNELFVFVTNYTYITKEKVLICGEKFLVLFFKQLKICFPNASKSILHYAICTLW